MMSQFSILIVDDEHEILELLQETFLQRNFLVKIAHCAKEAKTILMVEKFDVILSDFRMPGESGLAILNLINTFTIKPTFFFMSAHSDLPKSECMARGAKEYFEKPFSIDYLVNEVEQALREDSQSSMPFKNKLATVK
jgi:DNA-binding NtrC family response regulator